MRPTASPEPQDMSSTRRPANNSAPSAIHFLAFVGQRCNDSVETPGPTNRLGQFVETCVKSLARSQVISVLGGVG
jgi:hypothetical protein